MGQTFKLCKTSETHSPNLENVNRFGNGLGSQAVQDICQRIEKSYQLFFKYNKRGVRPPNFKKVKKYKSFTLKQAGYKLLGGNRIKIYKESLSILEIQTYRGKSQDCNR